MRNGELWHFIVLTIKCFVVLLVMGIFLPRALDCLLQSLTNNTRNYRHTIFVYKLVDKNYRLVYNYVLTFYLFFRG